MQHLQRFARVKHDKCIDNQTPIIRERQADNLVAQFAQPIRQKLYSVRRQAVLVVSFKQKEKNKCSDRKANKAKNGIKMGDQRS